MIFISTNYRTMGPLNYYFRLNDFKAGSITNTILAFRTVVQSQGKNLTVSTLEFIMEQIAVFLVQKSRGQAEASVAFLITFIKVMPAPLVANHLETMVSLKILK